MKRIVALDGGVNFRDIGGYASNDGRRVKWACVYRSGRLDKLSAAGSDAIKARGVRTIVDLRFPEEVQRFPTVMAGFPNARLIRWRQDETEHGGGRPQSLKTLMEDLRASDPDRIRHLMRERTAEFLETHAAVYGQMVEALANGETPLVFHCSAGKDRTGAGAALLLSLLGVDRSTVIQDYVLTQSQLADRMEAWMAGGAAPDSRYADMMELVGDLPHELIRPMFDADASYVANLFAYAEQKYGGLEQYAQVRLGQTPNDLRRLRDRLLEDAPKPHDRTTQ